MDRCLDFGIAVVLWNSAEEERLGVMQTLVRTYGFSLKYLSKCRLKFPEKCDDFKYIKDKKLLVACEKDVMYRWTIKEWGRRTDRKWGTGSVRENRTGGWVTEVWVEGCGGGVKRWCVEWWFGDSGGSVGWR